MVKDDSRDVFLIRIYGAYGHHINIPDISWQWTSMDKYKSRFYIF